MTVGKTVKKPLPAKRILVMRYRFIGDTILTVPFLRNLRRAYPDATIDFLAGPQSGTVLEGCPYIDNLIVFDTTDFHKYDRGRGANRSFLSYAWELRSKKYDLVFVLKRSLSSAVLALLTGARYRVGYDTEGRGLLLTHKVKWQTNTHEVRSTLDVLSAAGVSIKDDYLESWITEAESDSVLALAPQLRENRPKVLFHAAAAHPDKIYPLEKWAIVISELTKQYGVIPFFTGSEQDRNLYDRLQVMSDVEGVNLSGQLTLRQSMALLKQMDLAVCVDSGPAHLAAAAGIPVVAIFGPTDPVRWAPWGEQHTTVYDCNLACRPCNYKKTCNDERQCLTELDPQLVLRQCHRIMAATAAEDVAVVKQAI